MPKVLWVSAGLKLRGDVMKHIMAQMIHHRRIKIFSGGVAFRGDHFPIYHTLGGLRDRQDPDAIVATAFRC